LRGPNATIAAGGASGLQAIAYAADMIASGAIDAMVAGGADERSAEALAAIADAGHGDTSGGVPTGEAAAMIVVEAEESAGARGSVCDPERADARERREPDRRRPDAARRRRTARGTRRARPRRLLRAAGDDRGRAGALLRARHGHTDACRRRLRARAARRE